MAGWIKMALGTEVGLSPGEFVFDGPSPLPKKAAEPHKFSAHVYCGQTARWIKTALGVEVDLSPGDFVLDGNLARPLAERGQSPSPIFGSFLLLPNGWVHHDAI